MEKEKNFQIPESYTLRSKMSHKPGESTNAKKIKFLASKSSSRNRSKTIQGVNFKDQVGNRLNIPPPVTLRKSRSYEKNLKLANFLKKSNEMTNNITLNRSQPTSGKNKSSTYNEGSEVQKKKAFEISEEDFSRASKKAFEQESDNNKKPHKEKESLCKDLKAFAHLLPLCEKELKKIEDVWMNTIYCSLSLRANLLKFLFQEFPHEDKAQFNAEDKKLIQCLNQVKTCTKTEVNNLIKLAKSTAASREKTVKEGSSNLLRNYNNSTEHNKKTMMGGETLQLKTETSDHQQKKEVDDATETEKLQVQDTHKKKDQNSFLSFFSFGSSQQKNNQSNSTNLQENSSKQLTYESKETQSEIIKPISIQKEYENLKKKFSFQNEVWEKKIKELEALLEKKTKILKQEKEMKNRLQKSLNQYKAQKKRPINAIPYEQLQFLMRGPNKATNKQREELWLAAIKLILRGFFIQIKKLEGERNKMLFQLQSNDIENLNIAAAIIQKDNFVKSIRQQMRSFNTAYQKTKYRENYC